MAILFFSYCHADEAMRDMLEKHLSMLKRQGLIETWHDRRIPAGDNIDHSVSRELEAAEVILLLVSPDFLASDYCYDIEMRRALERHEAGQARVIPVILRHCLWHEAPFGKLLATPRDGKPVKGFPDLDEGFLQITQAIKDALKAVSPPAKAAFMGLAPAPAHAAAATPADVPGRGPRSSNLRLPRPFTDADKDHFQDEAFDYIAKFFDNSLAEIKQRNQGIDTTFKRIDAHQFTAAAYRQGSRKSWCRIFMGAQISGDGIAFSSNDTFRSGGYNECLTVHADNERMYLNSTGMATHSSGEKRLTLEGAAELYWDIFMKPLRQ